ncbi:MAG: hypothetical protein HYR62_04925 [Actinobacteria bacterium]|nr:hypothetical protein [Actinomycetota bacterium]
MHAIPAPKAFKDLLEDLLGRSVDIGDAEPFRADDLPLTVVAVYVDDAKKLSAVAGMDLVLAANVGAAIGLIPPGGAEACVEDRELSPMIAENVSEVCNVLVTLLNREGAPHLRLHQVHLPGETVPTDARGQLLALGNRLDLGVSVAGYGTGRFGLSLVG